MFKFLAVSSNRRTGLSPANTMVYAQNFSQEEFREWAEDMLPRIITSSK